MNKALVLGVAAVALFAAPSFANEETVDAQGLVAVTDSDLPFMAKDLPLPPPRPAVIPQRRVRVAQATPIEAPAPVLRPVASAPRKPSNIWLSIGYGF